MKLSIGKYIEYSEIWLKYSDEFNLECISDNSIITMLDNIENRILCVIRYKYFIIIRRVSDNKVFKSMINDDEDDDENK